MTPNEFCISFYVSGWSAQYEGTDPDYDKDLAYLKEKYREEEERA